ncbi:ComF family protein [Homoserinimonas sp. OAct 916]|uniref:ComF family protein n=1 Tax=Homoserinimonas sp. OAct 916 TaxID=2211450 RepID=UPI000DBE7F8A|nr:phosphoribosyltransferase family protein [Homoserinimonas sp. OAct 916]
MTDGGIGQWLSGAMRETFGVILPTQCAGCGRPDDSFCAGCVAALDPHLLVWTVRGPGDDVEARLEVSAALDYAGVVRAALIAFKDGGRTGAARQLARPLQAAIDHRLALTRTGEPDAREVALQQVPSTRAALRRRGYDPVGLLLKKAGLRSMKLLRHRGGHTDQAGLGAKARWQNLHGSLVADRAAAGLDIILVDDILTTGATLLEARRALTAAGARVLGAATVAHTGRRASGGWNPG